MTQKGHDRIRLALPESQEPRHGRFLRFDNQFTPIPTCIQDILPDAETLLLDYLPSKNDRIFRFGAFGKNAVALRYFVKSHGSHFLVYQVYEPGEERDFQIFKINEPKNVEFILRHIDLENGAVGSELDVSIVTYEKKLKRYLQEDIEEPVAKKLKTEE